MSDTQQAEIFGYSEDLREYDDERPPIMTLTANVGELKNRIKKELSAVYTDAEKGAISRQLDYITSQWNIVETLRLLARNDERTFYRSTDWENWIEPESLSREIRKRVEVFGSLGDISEIYESLADAPNGKGEAFNGEFESYKLLLESLAQEALTHIKEVLHPGLDELNELTNGCFDPLISQTEGRLGNIRRSALRYQKAVVSRLALQHRADIQRTEDSLHLSCESCEVTRRLEQTKNELKNASQLRDEMRGKLEHHCGILEIDPDVVSELPRDVLSAGWKTAQELARRGQKTSFLDGALFRDREAYRRQEDTTKANRIGIFDFGDGIYNIHMTEGPWDTDFEANKDSKVIEIQKSVAGLSLFNGPEISQKAGATHVPQGALSKLFSNHPEKGLETVAEKFVQKTLELDDLFSTAKNTLDKVRISVEKSYAAEIPIRLLLDMAQDYGSFTSQAWTELSDAINKWQEARSNEWQGVKGGSRNSVMHELTGEDNLATKRTAVYEAALRLQEEIIVRKSIAGMKYSAEAMTKMLKKALNIFPSLVSIRTEKAHKTRKNGREHEEWKQLNKVFDERKANIVATSVAFAKISKTATASLSRLDSNIELLQHAYENMQIHAPEVGVFHGSVADLREAWMQSFLGRGTSKGDHTIVDVYQTEPIVLDTVSEGGDPEDQDFDEDWEIEKGWAHGNRYAGLLPDYLTTFANKVSSRTKSRRPRVVNTSERLPSSSRKPTREGRHKKGTLGFLRERARLRDEADRDFREYRRQKESQAKSSQKSSIPVPPEHLSDPAPLSKDQLTETLRQWGHFIFDRIITVDEQMEQEKKEGKEGERGGIMEKAVEEVPEEELELLELAATGKTMTGLSRLGSLSMVDLDEWRRYEAKNAERVPRRAMDV